VIRGLVDFLTVIGMKHIEFYIQKLYSAGAGCIQSTLEVKGKETFTPISEVSMIESAKINWQWCRLTEEKAYEFIYMHVHRSWARYGTQRNNRLLKLQ
jgi:hypothetical protein